MIQEFYLSKEDIYEQIDYLRKNNGYGNEQTDKLNSIPIEKHKEFIYDPNYLDAVFTFVARNHKTINNSFQTICDNFKEALNQLEMETTDSFNKMQLEKMITWFKKDK